MGEEYREAAAHLQQQEIHPSIYQWRWPAIVASEAHDDTLSEVASIEPITDNRLPTSSKTVGCRGSSAHLLRSRRAFHETRQSLTAHRVKSQEN
jgi:hypothetical protein